MSPVRIPSAQDRELALSRLRAHAKKYVRRRGVKEIQARPKSNYLYLEVVKEAKAGLVGRMFGTASVRGVGRLARLEFVGPNKWKVLIYDYDIQKYTSQGDLREDTIEECLDAAARVYVT